MLDAVELEAADLLHHDAEALLEHDRPRLSGVVLDRKRLAAVADNHVIERVAGPQGRIHAQIIVDPAVGERDVLNRGRGRVAVELEAERREHGWKGR